MRAQPSPGVLQHPAFTAGFFWRRGSKKHGRGLILQPEAFAAGRGPPRPLHTPGSGLLQAWRTRTQPVSQPTGKTRVCDERAGWLGERKAADRGGDADQTDCREQSQEGGRAGTEGAGREGREGRAPPLRASTRPRACSRTDPPVGLLLRLHRLVVFQLCPPLPDKKWRGGSGLVFRSTGTMPGIQERMSK